MSYSDQTTYGRKVIKGTYKHKSEYYKRLYVSWCVCILIGFVVGVALTLGISFLFKDEPVEANETNTTQIETSESAIKTIVFDKVEVTPIKTVEKVEIKPTEPKVISLGEYKLTAYCSCEKCCGQWAANRPKDENGKPIIYTANMSVAKQGVTVAADTSVLPFGTVLLIDGNEYIVQDRGGAIKGNRIDVYFESHEEALQFGVQHKEIFLKKEGGGVINE